jgi:hypothetical protein
MIFADVSAALSMNFYQTERCHILKEFIVVSALRISQFQKTNNPSTLARRPVRATADTNSFLSRGAFLKLQAPLMFYGIYLRMYFQSRIPY